VELWNRWRRENPDIIPDLKKADLRGITFEGGDLKQADLFEADLSKSKLSKALILGANLCWSNLNGSDLNGARLIEAFLSDTNLTKANLSNATFWGSRFIRSNPNETILNGAVLGMLVFVDVDQSTAIGLENVRHHGPSTIGIDTIYASGGKIPEDFLRGFGDFTHWKDHDAYQKAFDRLMRNLKVEEPAGSD
jgi:hypothetical protein